MINYKDFIKNENTAYPKYLEYNSKIDYTNLNPDATETDIIKLCEQARKLNVKSVCILPKRVKIAAEELKDSSVLVCSVVDFPNGEKSIEEKVSETKLLIKNGADEIDVVMNYKYFLSKWKNNEIDEQCYEDILNDIKKLSKICHSSKNKNNEPIILKIIVESGKLNIDQTKTITNICIDGNVDFIKTSTGKVEIGAELDKIVAMKDVINLRNSNLKIKASGGIRTLDKIQSFNNIVDRFGIGWDTVNTLNGISLKD